MKSNQEQLEALNDIRQMMKQSTRFLSLSGLSGILAGIYALVGAYFGQELIHDYITHYSYRSGDQDVYFATMFKGFLICAGVLGASIITAIILTKRKANKTGQKLFDPVGIRLLINMLIPLVVGGIFCVALILKGFSSLEFVAPSMLIFYGLALVNASKYTLHDIRYLGFFEIILGLIASFMVSHGILFWAIGFGGLHIVYGTIMWFKYDRK
jgi:MFS family permease